MSLSPQDQLVFAYFLETKAREINIDGRYYPYGELLMSFRDKIKLSLNRFGRQYSNSGDPVARCLLDLMIAEGGLSVEKQEIGHDMHQFQRPKFLTMVNELLAENDIVQRSRADNNPEFWATEFANLKTHKAV